MLDLKIPAITILRKEIKPLYKDKFVVTYEYGWSESVSADNPQKHKSQQKMSSYLKASDQCSWVNITVTFPANRKQE